MKWLAGMVLIGAALFSPFNEAPAQNTNPSTASDAPTIASIMQTQLKILERQFVPAAEAMPEDKYSFVPTGTEFKGVRSFGLEVRHTATTNFIFYSAILGQDPPAGVNLANAANGPDNVQTKEQILKYLKDSFLLGHKAFATLTAQNAVIPVSKPPIPIMSTPLALATGALAHASDHYGQMTEYLRMNGITPPASKGQPPASPPGR